MKPGEVFIGVQFSRVVLASGWKLDCVLSLLLLRKNIKHIA